MRSCTFTKYLGKDTLRNSTWQILQESTGEKAYLWKTERPLKGGLYVVLQNLALIRFLNDPKPVHLCPFFPKTFYFIFCANLWVLWLPGGWERRGKRKVCFVCMMTTLDTLIAVRMWRHFFTSLTIRMAFMVSGHLLFPSRSPHWWKAIPLQNLWERTLCCISIGKSYMTEKQEVLL